MDKVSILKSSRFCTKHIKKRPNGELTASQVSVGSLFDHSYHSVKSLKELSELLKFVQNDAHSFVVRGELIDEANNSQIRRRVRPRDGEEPTFKAAARRWCCIDVDEIDLPEHLADFKINKEAIVAYTSLIYQSSSIMFNVGISFHPTWASNRARSDYIYGIG